MSNKAGILKRDDMGVVDIIKGLLTALFVMLLMVSLSLFIVSNSIKSTFLQPSFYSQMDSTVYLGIQSTLLDTVTSAIPQNQLSLLGITSYQVRQALSNQFTVEWVKDETTTLSVSLLGYVTGQTPTYNLTVSVGPQLTAAVSELISNSSAPQAATSQLTSLVGTEVPSQIDLSTLPGVPNTIENLKSSVTLFLTISTAVLVAIIVLLVLIFLLNMDLSKFAAIIGWPFLTTAIILGVVASVVPSFLSSSLSSELQNIGNGIQISPATVQTMVSVFQPMFANIFVQAVILAIIALLLIIFSFVYPRFRKNKKDTNVKTSNNKARN